jgi:hypothetical protein
VKHSCIEPDPELQAQIKQAIIEVQKYITALETENLRLKTQIAHLHAKNLSTQNRILARQQTTDQTDHGPLLSKLRTTMFGEPDDGTRAPDAPDSPEA